MDILIMFGKWRTFYSSLISLLAVVSEFHFFVRDFDSIQLSEVDLDLFETFPLCFFLGLENSVLLFDNKSMIRGPRRRNYII